MESIYLDYAATTPVDPRVVAAMEPFWSQIFGNSASIHAPGRAAAKELEASRAQIAQCLCCHPTEIVFTGSGTESANIALRGVAQSARKAGPGSHIITSSVEHHAVGLTVQHMQSELGFETTILPVDGQGLVDPRAVERAIRRDTVLISVMYANNEVGTIEPVDDIGRIARAYNIAFHTDAVQAGGKLDLNVTRLEADLLTLSAHKFYGPKGVGLLYVRRGTQVQPILTGGGQERGHRPGTVNVAGAVGMATALRLAEAERESENQRLMLMRDRLIAGVLEAVPEAQLTGHPQLRLADSASFVFRKCDGEALIMALDLAGVAASTGSACTTGDPEPSFVLTAMGLDPSWAVGSLRLTLGRWTREEHIERVLEVLPDAVRRTRAMYG